MQCNWMSPICGTSYGLSASYLIKELLKTGVEIYLSPIGPVQIEDQFTQFLKPILSPPQNWKFFPLAPCVRLYHQFDLNTWVGSGTRIGFPIFELDGFTDREIFNLKHPDLLIVCSKWAKDVVEEHVKRSSVEVVPLGVDVEIFRETELPPNDKTIFLNIGKFEFRKGHDILVKAFCSAFSKNDNVELWLCPKNFFLTREQENEWVSYYLNSALGDKIKLFNRVNTHEEVAAIIGKSHVGVFPSRAEGWNLPLLEVLACGRHAIASNVTAHTEYLTDKNCKLIKLTQKSRAYDGVFFNGQGLWHDWDNDSFDLLVDYMREFHELNMNNKLEINKNGVDTAKNFTWAKSASILKSFL